MNAQEYYLEFKNGTRVKIGANKKAQLLKYINEKIQRLIFYHSGIVAGNPQMKDYRIEQIDEYSHLIRVKQLIEPIQEPEAPEKEYDCLKVARAFCLWELFKTGQLEKYYQKRPDDYYRFKMNDLKIYIRSQFELKPEESSKTIYVQAIHFINSGRYDFYTKEYSKDYNYGLKLFNAMQ